MIGQSAKFARDAGLLLPQAENTLFHRSPVYAAESAVQRKEA